MTLDGRSQRARCAAGCAALIWAALTLQACRDRAPSEPLARRPVIVASLAPPSAPPAPGTQTAVLPSGNGSEGAVGPITLSGDAYAETTLVEVVVSGIISRTRSGSYAVWHGAAGLPWTPLDPGGEYVAGGISDCLGNVTVDFHRSGGSYGGGTGFCDVFNVQDLRAEWRGTAVVRGTGRASRDGSYIVGNWIACRPNCYVYEGEQQVTVTPTADKLTLVAAPAEGLAGRVVQFTTSTTDGSPYTVRDWIYVADDTAQAGLGAAGDSSTACVAPHASCDGVAEATGTIYVRATVHGVTEQASARVTVAADSLVLTATPSQTKPGLRVTFNVATVYGSAFSVQDWSWTGSSVDTGTPLTNDGSDCPGGAATCVLSVFESGTMTVRGSVMGMSGLLTASASVAVDTCVRSGDRRVDDPHFRKQMLDLLAASQADAYTEHGADLEVNPLTGEHRVIEIPSSLHSPCRYSASGPPVVDSGFVLDTVDIHTHPYRAWTKFTGCDQPGVSPVDTVSARPGPSEGIGTGDWSFSTTHALIPGAMGTTGYLIDGDRYIWRWNYPLGPNWSPANTRWERDADGSICFQPTVVP